MATTTLDRIKLFLPVIGIFILMFLIYRLGVENIIEAFLSINLLYILVALLLTIPMLVIRVYGWQLILQEQKIPLRFFPSMKVLLMGFFYGIITPGYAGQLMRIPYMRVKTEQPYGKLFASVVTEVALRTIPLYGMMIVGAFFIASSIPNLLIVTVLWMVCITGLIVYFMKKERGEKVFDLLLKYIIPKKLKGYFSSFADTFYTDYPRLITFSGPILLGLCTWVIVFTQEYLVALSMGITTIPYFAFLLLFPIANVAGFIPITFAGLGTRELTAVFLFSTLFSVPGQDIFVFSLVGFLITDIFVGVVGLLLSFTEVRAQPLESLEP